jgi:glutamine cyclotransferase
MNGAKKRKRAAADQLAPPSRQKNFWSSWWILLGIVLLSFVTVYAGIRQLDGTEDGIAIRYRVVAEYPHDELAFTQGLVFYRGKLYESTGRYGESTLREVEPQTGKVLRRVDVAPEFFAEGLCLWDNEWLQLTWKEKTILHYDRDSLEATKKTSWGRQGWGLTHNGKELIISDGTSRLFFVDPESGKSLRDVDVTLAGRRQDHLNELEFVDGFIYANVWYKKHILKIDPSDGKVVGMIELDEPMRKMGLRDREKACNGIAYNSETGHFYVTGKLWPKILEIELEGK